MPTPLGHKIRALRKEKGYTLDKLAELASVSKSYVWELENREAQRPSAEKIRSIADVLGVTSDYLIEQDARPPKQKELDDAFFRNYQKLGSDDKKKLGQILDAFRKGK